MGAAIPARKFAPKSFDMQCFDYIDIYQNIAIIAVFERF
jgi:hypothetical protein